MQATAAMPKSECLPSNAKPELISSKPPTRHSHPIVGVF